MSPATTTKPADKIDDKKAAKKAIEEAALKAVQAELKKVLLEQVMKATPGLDPKAPKAPAKPKKDPKVEALEKAFRSAAFYQSSDGDEVAKLFEAFLGVKLEIANDQAAAKVKPFMLVVPTADKTSGHDYQPGSVCMFRSQGGTLAIEVLKGKLRVGNSLPTKLLEDTTVLRYATMTEAEEFVGKVVSTFENIQALRGYMGNTLDSLLDQ